MKKIVQLKRNLGLCIALGLLLMATAHYSFGQVLRESKAEVSSGGDQDAGYGYSTGLFGVTEGQTARLIVWNKGKEEVPIRLRFVDDQGKVLTITFGGSLLPGKSTMLDWPCCGGDRQRVEMQAQFGTIERRMIGLLVPTVQIIDGTSNTTLWMFGQEGFTEIRPIWVP